MNHPLKRFLVSLFVPPAVGAIIFTLSMTLDNLGRGSVWEYLGAVVFVYLYAFVFCFVPGSLFYLAHEGLAKLGSGSYDNKPRYIGIGAFLGSFCGLTIGVLFGAEALLMFVPTGVAAGAITSWINFPKRQREN